MKIEKLTENKIRIILNIDELAQKNIDFRSLIKNTDTAQKLFKKILKQAEKEVGFDASDAKLLIEAFVSAEGFFIITFTKLSKSAKSKENTLVSTKPSNTVTTEFKPQTIKAKRKMPSYLARTAIYEFDSFDEFCSFCTYLDNSPLKNLKDLSKSILLYEYKSKYFLVFSKINTDFKNINLFYTSISEFARLVSNSEYFEGELIEFGKLILKNNAIKNAPHLVD